MIEQAKCAGNALVKRTEIKKKRVKATKQYGKQLVESKALIRRGHYKDGKNYTSLFKQRDIFDKLLVERELRRTFTALNKEIT